MRFAYPGYNVYNGFCPSRPSSAERASDRGREEDEEEQGDVEAAGMKRPDGEPWGTWGCASVIVRAPDFSATNLTIENAFDYVGNLAAPKFEPIGPNGAQAVALRKAFVPFAGAAPRASAMVG